MKSVIAPIFAVALLMPSSSIGGTVVSGTGNSEYCYSETYAKRLAVLEAKSRIYDSCRRRGGVRRFGNPATRCFPCRNKQYRCTAGLSAECRR